MHRVKIKNLTGFSTYLNERNKSKFIDVSQKKHDKKEKWRPYPKKQKTVIFGKYDPKNNK